MLENLRNQTSFEPGDEEEPQLPILDEKPKRPKKKGRSLDQITGMKAPQRFFLSLMLLIIVCLLGVILLVVTGKVVPPLGF
jgi:hypothetical protein